MHPPQLRSSAEKESAFDGLLALQLPTLRGEGLIRQAIGAIQNKRPQLGLLPAIEASNIFITKPEIAGLVAQTLLNLARPDLARITLEAALSDSPDSPLLLQLLDKLLRTTLQGADLQERLAELSILTSKDTSVSSSPAAPAGATLDDLAFMPDLIHSVGNDGVIDVLVPVFKGLDSTIACLKSLLDYQSANKTPYRIVVLDDAGPDPQLTSALEQLAQQGRIHYQRRSTNLGFIKNMNRGMAMHPGRDVVWLNSDTRVHGNWLDRLRTCAYRDDRVASVTPLSNNGELMSMPSIYTKAAMPTPDQHARLDLVASLLSHPPVEIPLGCGFCFYIKRAAINAVGYLDEVALSRGYGEETDWCLRASSMGWRHLGAPNVYVAHQGGVSFGLEKALRAKQNNKVIRQRYPDADALCNRFRLADPLQQIRKRIYEEAGAAKSPNYPQGSSVNPIHQEIQPGAVELAELIRDQADSYWVIADRITEPAQGEAWLAVAKTLRRMGCGERLILTEETPWEVLLRRSGTVLMLPRTPAITPAELLRLCGARRALTLLAGPTDLNRLAQPIQALIGSTLTLQQLKTLN